MNEFVIISKDVFEEMVGKFNRFSDRVNEILGKREEGRLSRWMDNQDVCQQLRISPRTLQTLRDNGTRGLFWCKPAFRSPASSARFSD